MTVMPRPDADFRAVGPLPEAHPPVRTGKIGVLLLNLGTPDAPTTGPMRRYLKEFLSDRRVIEMPRWLWWPILNLIILTVRPGRKGKDYDIIWNKERDEGPLKTITRAQAEKLAASLAAGATAHRGRLGDALRQSRPRVAASGRCRSRAATASCWCRSIRSTARPRRRRPATRPSRR